MTLRFSEWWAANSDHLKTILSISWLLPKKFKKAIGVINTLIMVLDMVAEKDLTLTSFERDVLPCIRVNPDGSTTIINCKTGLPIKN